MTWGSFLNFGFETVLFLAVGEFLTTVLSDVISMNDTIFLLVFMSISMYFRSKIRAKMEI